MQYGTQYETGVLIVLDNYECSDSDQAPGLMNSFEFEKVALF